MGVLLGVLRGRFRAGQYRRGAVHAQKALTAAFTAAVLCTASALYPGLATAQSATSSEAAVDTRPEVNAALPQAQLVGKTRLSVFGFQIYDARLWAAPGFGGGSYSSQPLALELTYLRDFKALDIAERSVKEMRRSSAVSDRQETKWLADMQRVVPDVKKGDRILGIHKPGIGADFWVNGKPVGDIADPEFAKLFFGIWLSPKTSEPQMRSRLLNGAAG